MKIDQTIQSAIVSVSLATRGKWRRPVNLYEAMNEMLPQFDIDDLQTEQKQFLTA